MYLADDVQKTLRELGKISKNEVVKREGDIYVAVNVLNNSSRILVEEVSLIESLNGNRTLNKRILKG